MDNEKFVENDLELLNRIREHDDVAMDAMIDKYKPLIYKIVKDYQKFFKRFGYELDDLMQLGYITLYETSHKYDIYNTSMFY